MDRIPDTRRSATFLASGGILWCVTFDDFVAAQLPALLRYAVMLTGDRQLAEDVLQDTMVRIHQHWRRVEQAADPDRYVRRMVTNQYLGWRRRAWRRRTVPVAQVPDRPVPDSAATTVLRDDLWARLARLPARQRA